MRRAGALAAALALLLAAPAASAAPGPQAYRAKANAICRASRRALDAIPNPTTRAQWISALGQALRIEARDIAESSALQPPPALASLHRQVVASLGRTQAIGQAWLRELRSGAGIQATLNANVPRLASLKRERLALSARLGLRDCAKR